LLVDEQRKKIGVHQPTIIKTPPGMKNKILTPEELTAHPWRGSANAPSSNAQ